MKSKILKTGDQAMHVGFNQGASMCYMVLTDKFDFSKETVLSFIQDMKISSQAVANSYELDKGIIDWMFKYDYFIVFKENKGIVSKSMSNLIEIKLAVKGHTIGHCMYVLKHNYAFSHDDLSLFKKFILELQDSVDKKYLSYDDMRNENVKSGLQ